MFPFPVHSCIELPWCAYTWNQPSAPNFIAKFPFFLRCASLLFIFNISIKTEGVEPLKLCQPSLGFKMANFEAHVHAMTVRLSNKWFVNIKSWQEHAKWGEWKVWQGKSVFIFIFFRFHIYFCFRPIVFHMVGQLVIWGVFLMGSYSFFDLLFEAQKKKGLRLK